MASCCKALPHLLAKPSPGCAAVRATPHVALFVSSPQQLALVQGQTQWRGPLIKAFMVSGVCQRGVREACGAHR